MQGAQILRNEAYIKVRCNDEGCSATQQMDFLRSRHCLIEVNHVQGVRDLWKRPLLRPQCQSCEQQDEACLVSEPAKDEGSEE
jgi:hypothetical protein